MNNLKIIILGLIILMLIFGAFLYLRHQNKDFTSPIREDMLQKSKEIIFYLNGGELQPKFVEIQPPALLICKFISTTGDHRLRFISAPSGLQGRKLDFSLEGETKTIMLNIPKDFEGEYIFQVTHTETNKTFEGKIIIRD